MNENPTALGGHGFTVRCARPHLPGQRVYHYIRNTFSLCGKLGFYRGDLAPDAPEKRGRQDCKACIKKLDHAAKRGAPPA